MFVNEPTTRLSGLLAGRRIRLVRVVLAAAISASCATTVAPAAARLSEYHFITDASRRLAGNVKGGLAYPGGVALPPDRLHRVIVAGAVDPTDRSSGLMFRLGPYGKFDRTFGRKGFARCQVRARVRGVHTRDVSAAGIGQSRDRILVAAEDQAGSPEKSRTDLFSRQQAGLQIDDINTSGRCTNAFSAVDRDASPRKYFILSAGHCTDTGWNKAITVFLGNTTRMAYSEGKNSDSQAISVSHDDTSNAIFLPGYTRRVYRVEAIADDEVKGELVCKSGVGSGVTCGKLVDREHTVTAGDGDTKFKLYNMRRASYRSKEGDSGAPVYRKVNRKRAVAVGIHRGRDGLLRKRAVYSHVQRVERDLNLFICLPGREQCGR